MSAVYELPQRSVEDDADETLAAEMIAADRERARQRLIAAQLQATPAQHEEFHRAERDHLSLRRWAVAAAVVCLALSQCAPVPA